MKLIVEPADSKEQKVYELTRQKVELTEQHAKGQVIEAKGEGNKPIKIGVIHLPAFYGDTAAVMAGDPNAVSVTRDCRNILADFKKQKVDAVVVDVRNDPGGLLEEAISLSGLFIDTGPVVQVREPRSVKHLDDEDAGTAYDGPLVVLIDHSSASASEIFAGVIKDYGRGLIVGDSTTFGKGTVQSVIPLNEQVRVAEREHPAHPGAGLKLTIQQFYRPNGESTQIKGVPSDVHIPSRADQAEVNEGKLDTALKFDKLPPLPHDEYRRVPQALVVKLQERSDERRKASPKFNKQEEQIKKFIGRKAADRKARARDHPQREEVPRGDQGRRQVRRRQAQVQGQAPRTQEAGLDLGVGLLQRRDPGHRRRLHDAGLPRPRRRARPRHRQRRRTAPLDT